MAIDCATIDSYQGQEKDLVFFASTASASSSPKFVANVRGVQGWTGIFGSSGSRAPV